MFDLEGWRLSQGLSYKKLACLLGIENVDKVKKYSKGEIAIPAHYLDRAVQVSGGSVSKFEVFRRRQIWRARTQSWSADICFFTSEDSNSNH